MRLVLKHHFDAAHRLPNYNGKCASLHGHRWEVEVEVKGQSDPVTGMLIDFTIIKHIIDQYDHKHLNDFIENPTAENIATALQQLIMKEITFLQSAVEKIDSHTPYVVVVRIWESPGCLIEVGLC